MEFRLSLRRNEKEKKRKRRKSKYSRLSIITSFCRLTDVIKETSVTTVMFTATTTQMITATTALQQQFQIIDILEHKRRKSRTFSSSIFFAHFLFSKIYIPYIFPLSFVENETHYFIKRDFCRLTVSANLFCGATTTTTLFSFQS